METTTNTTTKLFTGIPVIEFQISDIERGIMEELQDAAKESWYAAGYQSDEHQAKMQDAWDYEFGLIARAMDRQFVKINKLDSVKISDSAWSAFSIWAKERDVQYRIISVNPKLTRIIITQI